MAAPVRYPAYLGYLVATDNSYTVPDPAYSSNIASQMTQAQNYTDWLVARGGSIFPNDGGNPVSSSIWFLEPSAPTNVAFDTFNDTTLVATGLPQQMSPFVDVNTAVWGIYFGAIPGQGQLAAAVGKIQVYGVTVTGLAGDGNNPENTTSVAALTAMVQQIGNKYENFNYYANGFNGANVNSITDLMQQAQSTGVLVTLNGAPLYQV